MSSRRNRRALVVLTYAGIAVLTVLMGVMAGASFQSPMWLVIIFSGVSRGLFGAVVPQQTLRDRPQNVVEARLGLSASGQWVEAPADEREIGLRNAAYFSAFRVVTLYALVVWFTVLLMQDPKLHMSPVILQVVTTPLIMLVVTLPQAILLWNHPDLLEEE